MQKYTFDEIKEMLYEKYGYTYVNGDFKGIKSMLVCTDKNKYMYMCNIEKMIYNNTKPILVHSLNPYSLYNINRFLEINGNNEFICISNKYINNKTELEFKHLKCGRIIKNKWINICRGRYKNNVGKNKTGLFCEHCETKQLESTHALVLKQVWLHEYKDTIVEDKSCYNPNTKYIMPTDIVNHRLKIAIEIQSWFHDFENQKLKDEIKRKFWIDKGYKFYSIDQRDYTVLQMIQLFFPFIKEIPSYIDFSYSNKFDDVTAQNLLNQYKSVNKVSKVMKCNPHLIYDAISHKRISYPSNYINNSFNQVVQLDLNCNFIKEYDTIQLAQKENNITGISQTLRNGRNYCGGYYWVKKSNYYKGCKIIKTRLKK